MNLNEYQEWTKTTAQYPEENAIVYLALGLGNEAGELQGVVKKWLRTDYDVYVLLDKMRAELGDVLWYLTRLADTLGITVEELAQMNHDKLEDRKMRGVIKGSGDNR